MVAEKLKKEAFPRDAVPGFLQSRVLQERLARVLNLAMQGYASCHFMLMPPLIVNVALPEVVHTP